jgi:AIG2-like family
LYFAYGSNMDRAAMLQRCPRSKALGPARLMRHRFFVCADGYASVARDPHRVVWGLLWDLALADVPALDRYESIATGLYIKTVLPVLAERGPRRAMLYVARSTAPGVPKPAYMEGIVAAAAELPEVYRRELVSLVPSARSAAEPADAPSVRPLWSAPTGVRRTSRN